MQMINDKMTIAERPAGHCSKPHVACRFSSGDRIVWDSGHGYDIGFFVSDKGVMYNTYLVDIITGLFTGEVSHSISQIKPYSKDLIKELSARYGYEKDWSEVF